MDPICNYLGIYPDNIEAAAAMVEEICEERGIDSDEKVWEYVKQWFEETFETNNFGNVVVGCIFHELRSALVEEGIGFNRIDYHVNGADLGFYIDGEQAA